LTHKPLFTHQLFLTLGQFSLLKKNFLFNFESSFVTPKKKIPCDDEKDYE
jgi:hypothetical protein